MKKIFVMLKIWSVFRKHGSRNDRWNRQILMFWKKGINSKAKMTTVKIPVWNFNFFLHEWEIFSWFFKIIFSGSRTYQYNVLRGTNDRAVVVNMNWNYIRNQPVPWCLLDLKFKTTKSIYSLQKDRGFSEKFDSPSFPSDPKKVSLLVIGT